MLFTLVANLLIFLSLLAVVVIVIDSCLVDAIDLWHMENDTYKEN